jgi:23S rRNA (cytosine1962-C5)-methyltransferase
MARGTVVAVSAPAFGDVGRVRELLAKAAERRDAIARVTDAFRLIDDAADGMPGVVVDRYADWAVLSVMDERADAQATAIAAALVEHGFHGVYLKRRPRGDARHADAAELAPPSPILGSEAPADLAVREHSLRFRVALGDGASTGLFTDQRDNRELVRRAAEGARVLNLFAYTCSFTVAAAVGGAAETVSVDLSRRALSRGGENLALNGVAGERHRLLKSDAVQFLSRMVRGGTRFDLVVLDPPSFGTRARGTFSVERDYSALATQCFSVLAPGGRLLAVTNHRKTGPEAFVALLRDAARTAGRRVESLEPLAMPADHSHRPLGEPPTKSAIVHTS